MTDIESDPRTLRTPSIFRSLPLLAACVAAFSLMLCGSAHAQAVRDAVFSLKADCSVVGPFAGSYEKGWKVEYKSDFTVWLACGRNYRAPLRLMARGYQVGTGEYLGAEWFVTFEQAD
ncbi:MAG TPA: hypothetical protein VGI45_04505, partial [Terracidiphilus sp.]